MICLSECPCPVARCERAADAFVAHGRDRLRDRGVGESCEASDRLFIAPVGDVAQEAVPAIDTPDEVFGLPEGDVCVGGHTEAMELEAGDPSRRWVAMRSTTVCHGVRNTDSETRLVS